MLSVRARAPVHPSEDAAKVETAVRHIFPDAEVRVAPDRVEASTDSLDSLKDLIHRQRILDAARKSLLRSLRADPGRARLLIHKQAAFAGRLTFAESLDAPLGDIEVTVEGPDLEMRFKEIAPMTVRGVPVSEERAEEILAKRRRIKENIEAAPKDVDDFLHDDDLEVGADGEDAA